MTHPLTRNQITAIERRMVALVRRAQMPKSNPAEKPVRLGADVKLRPRPVETRPAVGRFAGGTLGRARASRAKTSRARVALRRQTDG